MNEFDNYNQNKLDIYISYEQLTAKSFGLLLQSIGSLGDEILYSYLKSKNISFNQQSGLVIDYINTGNSIKFRFGEGWIPSITSDADNDIIITTPKKIGIPLLIGYLLLTSVQKFQEIRNTQLDNRIKQIEIQLKESELRKLNEEPEKTFQFQKESDKIVRQIITNQDYKIIQIFDIDIKTIDKPEDKE